MEKLKEILKTEQATNQLQTSGQTNLVKKDDHYELSVYSDGITPKGYAKAVNQLKTAFPNLSDGFHDILSDRILAHKFTDQRFMDSVNHVIDTCKYPTPDRDWETVRQIRKGRL